MIYQIENHFYEINHSSDLAIHVSGEDLPQLFIHATLSMYQLMKLKVGEEFGEDFCISINAIDRESQLINFLNEVLFYIDQQKVLIPSEIMFDLNKLSAKVKCYKLAGLERSIKAATFNNLEISKSHKGYFAEIVFDV